MNAVEFAATSFAVCNSLRVLAYIPQIISLARQRDGARAISCLAWTSFTASNVTAVVYAIVVVSDTRMAALFAANTVCCFLVVALTVWKRVRWSGQRDLTPTIYRTVA